MVKKQEKKDNLLIGMWVHTFTDESKDGLVFQGEILEVDRNIVLVNIFSWIDGTSTHVKPMSKSLIYSPKCTLYFKREDMLAAYEKYCEKNK